MPKAVRESHGMDSPVNLNYQGFIRQLLHILEKLHYSEEFSLYCESANNGLVQGTQLSQIAVLGMREKQDLEQRQTRAWN